LMVGSSKTLYFATCFFSILPFKVRNPISTRSRCPTALVRSDWPFLEEQLWECQSSPFSLLTSPPLLPSILSDIHSSAQFPADFRPFELLNHALSSLDKMIEDKPFPPSVIRGVRGLGIESSLPPSRPALCP